MNLKQPVLGIVSTLLCTVIALWICSLFSVDTFNTWVGFIAVAAIPGQIILALVWESNYPNFLGKLKQPVKGCVLFLLMAVIGCITAALFMFTVGGGVTPPTPMLIQFSIVTVIMTMWTVVAWQCWPLNAISKHPGIIGVGTLLLTFVISLVVFKTLINYSFMADAPFYAAELDPGGALNAWTAMTYLLTTVAVIDALILLDFWPVSVFQERYKALSIQPLAGLLNSVFILLVAYGIWYTFIKLWQFEVVDYMVRVVVSFVFGEFIMLVMMQTAPFTNLKQPLKGVCLLICCGILGVVMYWLYSTLSVMLIGSVPKGPPTYDLDLWLAGAMLSITFPLLIVFADFFKFWPLSKEQ
jgi:hypothetical protein